MKLLMGFIILLVALVAVTGCTQTASPSAQTPTETTAPATEATTVTTTTVATTAETTVPAETATIVANVTAPEANTTANVTATQTATAVPTVTYATGVTTIHITSAGFIPQGDVVLPGTGIIWANDDNVTHMVKATGNSTGMFNSGDILPGATFTYTFSENTGTYTYALADNKTVTGTIVVKAPCTLGGC